MRTALPVLLALVAVVQAQQASSPRKGEPNLMDMILAPITSNIKHAIPVNTIPAELAASNTTSTGVSQEEAPAAEAAIAEPVQVESEPVPETPAEPESEEVATASPESTEDSVVEPAVETEAANEPEADKPAEKRGLNKPPGIIVNVDNGSHRRRSVKMGNNSHANAKMVKRVHKAAGIERKYGAGGK